MKIVGEENLKKYILKAVQENNSGELLSILVGKPIVYYFGAQFADTFMNLRKEKNIFLKSLRLTEKNFDTPKHKDCAFYKKEVKYKKSDIFKKNFLLFDGKIFVFDGEKNMGEYSEDKNIFNEYKQKFEKIWNS